MLANLIYTTDLFPFALYSNPNPILARVEINAGHGAGKSTQKIIEGAVDKYCITAKALGLKMIPVPKATL